MDLIIFKVLWLYGTLYIIC